MVTYMQVFIFSATLDFPLTHVGPLIIIYRLGLYVRAALKVYLAMDATSVSKHVSLHDGSSDAEWMHH